VVTAEVTVARPVRRMHERGMLTAGDAPTVTVPPTRQRRSPTASVTVA
jgi:hypothetical protein